jgi:hypothetical protein
MPDPPKTLRQKFVDAIVARMQTILTTNGYVTNAGQKVEAWRTHWEEDELVDGALGVFDLTNESEKEHRQSLRQKNTLTVQIRIFVAKGSRAEKVRQIEGDVFKAIRSDDRWTVDGKGMAIETRPKQDGFIIPQDSFEVAAGAVEIEIEYLSNTFDAYA